MILTDWEHGFGTCASCGTWGVHGEPCLECGRSLHGNNFIPPSALEVEEEQVRDKADRDGDSFVEDRL